ncbi:hypothetical protein FRC08_018229 [Ceratobasidium sp. 394]|nr:hypothetical protein FRC08_018229 [Ceratobasidium sp. 394]
MVWQVPFVSFRLVPSVRPTAGWVPSIPRTSASPTRQALWSWVKQPARADGHGSRPACPIISASRPPPQLSTNQTQLPPPPSLSGTAGSLFAEVDRRTCSPSPHGPPPNLYATRPSQNNFAPQGYNGYPGSDAAWEREKAREAQGCESD